MNRKGPKEDSYHNHCVYFGVSCFLPCILLGNIQTITSREQSYKITKCCGLQLTEMGDKGCQTCGYTSLLYLMGGPLAPCLSCHVMNQRRQINTLYRDDKVRLPEISWKNYLPLLICWPYNLMEQYSFLLEMKRRDILAFDWDLANSKDLLTRPNEEFATKKLFLIGPYSEGKTELFRKLLKFCEAKNLKSIDKMDPMSMNYDAEEEKQELLEKQYHSIKVGIKTFMRVRDKIIFLEIWNVPDRDLHSMSVELSLPHAVAALFVFDGCEGRHDKEQQSFSAMQDLFIDTIEVHPAKKVCVMVNHHQQAADPLEPLEEGSTAFDLTAAKRWASVSQCDFLEVVTEQNEGLRAIGTMLTSLIAAEFEEGGSDRGGAAATGSPHTGGEGTPGGVDVDAT